MKTIFKQTVEDIENKISMKRNILNCNYYYFSSFIDSTIFQIIAQRKLFNRDSAKCLRYGNKINRLVCLYFNIKPSKEDLKTKKAEYKKIKTKRKESIKNGYCKIDFKEIFEKIEADMKFFYGKNKKVIKYSKCKAYANTTQEMRDCLNI